jgi:quercetin dioxygenase-like cupin family protein
MRGSELQETGAISGVEALPSSAVAPGASLVPPDGGEQLLFRAGPIPCLITLKVSPAIASSSFTVGTWEFPVDYVIPMHKHAREDEVLFFTRGHFSATVDGLETTVGPGTTLNLPRGAWHEVRNTSGEPGQMVWFVSPPGVEGFFREASVPPGTPWTSLPPAEIARLAAKYGLTLRPEPIEAAPDDPSTRGDDGLADELVPRALAILAEETERWETLSRPKPA